MKSFENPSLTMHNVTIVTRLRSPNISTKDPKKKNPKEKQTSKSSTKTSYQKNNNNNYTNKNKLSRINDSKSLKRANQCPIQKRSN